MLFLARSALCIGVVAAAASGLGPGDVVTRLHGDARTIVEASGRACMASRDCVRIGAGAPAAAMAVLPASDAAAHVWPTIAPRRQDTPWRVPKRRPGEPAPTSPKAREGR